MWKHLLACYGSLPEHHLPTGHIDKPTILERIRPVVNIIDLTDIPGFRPERQNWIQDEFNFLKTHIKHKGLKKSSGFKSPAQGASASTASAYDISRGSTDMESVEISMQENGTKRTATTQRAADFLQSC